MAPQQKPEPGPPRGLPSAAAAASVRFFTWDEIGLRTKPEDPNRQLWLVMDRKVYDIASFSRRHPGGSRILNSHVGEEVTGASANWWNLLHSQHHSKPNCVSKDPDTDIHPFLFSLGKSLSVELGIKKTRYMPYNYQHKYFFITMPPLLFPAFFQFHTFYVTFKKKFWVDLAWLASYYIRLFFMYGSLLGIKSFMLYYLLFRMMESSWFVWVSQMSHIPMNVDYDKNLDWVSTQLQATCNVEKSSFNDWFTGHLNFQIEHHLFPTMPRHNLWKATPLVKSLCAKHGIEYKCKTLLTAFADILHSLKDSGDLGLDAYLHK